MIDLSFNEVEMLGAKAARGAGFSWGLAEEIGRAARRLAPDTGTWGPALASLLRHMHDFDPPDPARADRWRHGVADVAGSRQLCPIRTATLLLDDPVFSSLPSLTIAHVGLPLWLDAMLRASHLAAAYEGDMLAASADVAIGRRVSSPAGSGGRRGAIDQDTLAALNTYAARTYVPESERSRTRGAGGGRVDDE